MTSFAIRPLGPDEDELLRRACYTAITWRVATPEQPHPPQEEVLAKGAYLPYVEGWGRDGDAGLVAVVDGQDVGGSWYRRFTEDRPGMGFVDTATPELGIGVFDQRHRGSGIGRALLACLLTQARLERVPRISLAVNGQNPARHLYASLGFEVEREMEGGLVMVHPLGSRRG